MEYVNRFIQSEVRAFGIGNNFTLSVESGLLGFFSPYFFKVSQRRPTRLFRTIWDVFPEAKDVWEENASKFGDDFGQIYVNNQEIPRIKARYFLNVEENAAFSQIRDAYQELRRNWEQKLTSQNLAERKLAQEVLEVIHGAYFSITEGNKYAIDFEQMIARLAYAPEIHTRLLNYEL